MFQTVLSKFNLLNISGRQFLWLNFLGIVTFYILYFHAIEEKRPSVLVNHFNSFNSIINNNIFTGENNQGLPTEPKVTETNELQQDYVS